jgi:acetyl esterase/lipase
MHITKDMIHPELRRIGMVIHFLLPSFTERKFRWANRFLDKFMKGKCRSDLCYEEKWIQRQEGGKLRICVYSPETPEGNVPGLLWIHGGGYAIGVPEVDEFYIRRFIKASGCVVIAPDYRRSLEAAYPAALEDCYTTLLWMKEHCTEYGIRSDQLMVAGNSAGGGLTAAVSLFARDKGEVSIAFQMPLYPMLDDRMNTESAKGNDAPLWNSKSNEIAWKLYLGDKFGTEEIPVYAAPARETDYRNLPPTCTFVGSIEPFRDETVAYVEALRTQGVPVHFKLYEGCFHAFDLIGAGKSIGKAAIKFMMETFQYAVKHYFAEQPS